MRHYDLSIILNLQPILIPMRGNEHQKIGTSDPPLQRILIPMRGNEGKRCSMRSARGIGDTNPHEG